MDGEAYRASVRTPGPSGDAQSVEPLGKVLDDRLREAAPGQSGERLRRAAFARHDRVGASCLFDERGDCGLSRSALDTPLLEIVRDRHVPVALLRELPRTAGCEAAVVDC